MGGIAANFLNVTEWNGAVFSFVANFLLGLLSYYIRTYKRKLIFAWETFETNVFSGTQREKLSKILQILFPVFSLCFKSFFKKGYLCKLRWANPSVRN